MKADDLHGGITATIGSVGLARAPTDLSGWSFAAGWMALAALATFQLILIFAHSPWFDEAHALLISRAPWSDLLHNLKYEGHPALWYLWLGTFDRIFGGSAWSLPFAQAPVALGLIALIWFRGPFSARTRLLILAGYFFAFEYGVISRSYGLGALLILSAVPLRSTAWGWVCLAFAANTSAHDLVAAGAVGGVFFMERPNWRGPFILILGICVALLTVYPVAKDLFPTSGAPHGPLYVRALRGLVYLSETIVPAVPQIPYRWYSPLPPVLGLLGGLGVLPAGVWVLRRQPWAAAGFVGLYAALLGLSITTYQLSTRHVGVLVVYLVACLWIGAERGHRLSRLGVAWLISLAACGVAFVSTQGMRPFTEHRAIAAWIRTHGLANETWGAWPGREGTTITSQFGRATLNLEKDCLNTFIRWDYPHERVRDPIAHIHATGARYVISETRLPRGQLLAKFGVGGGWEWQTWIYRFDNEPKQVPICR